MGWNCEPAVTGDCTQRQHLYLGEASMVRLPRVGVALPALDCASSGCLTALAGADEAAGSLFMNCWALLIARLISSSVLMSLKWQVWGWRTAAAAGGDSPLARDG